MHLLLTDRLACPRCGPDFGLILLAERIEERRVYEGSLGCPNCRDRFPVEGGFGDLRAPPRSELPPPEPAASDEDEGAEARETEKVAALLGVTRGPGHLALVGPVAGRAGALADLLDEVEVVAVDAAAREWEEREGVSRLAAGPGLPFFSRSLRGVALSGDAPARLAGEAARTVAAMGRVVVLGADEESRSALEEAGLTPVLDEDGVVVCQR